MLLKGDVTTIVQKWGSTLRHAGSKMGLVYDKLFSTQVVHAALDSKKVQTRLLLFCITEEAAAYRSRNKYQIPAKRITIQ
jgi:hypothetical protein